MATAASIATSSPSLGPGHPSDLPMPDKYGYLDHRAPIFQRYLQQTQYQDDAETEEEEPVHALDLRICKVNETISRFNETDVFGRPSPTQQRESDFLPPSSGENRVQNPPDNSPSHPEDNSRRGENPDAMPREERAEHPSPGPRYRSPMPSAFPGQIPPDRRYTESPDQAIRNIMNQWPPLAAAAAAAAAAASINRSDLRLPPPMPNSHSGSPNSNAGGTSGLNIGVRSLSELTEERSSACRLVEAATTGWRFSPYERPPSRDKSFIKSERCTPSPRPRPVHLDESNSRNSLVMRTKMASSVSGVKSTFLHNVLKNKEKTSPITETGIKKEPMELGSGIRASSLDREVSSRPHHELDRRMEILDQTFRTHKSRYLMLQEYSPPPSPQVGSLMGLNRVHQNPHMRPLPPPGFGRAESPDPEQDLAMRQKEFLMRLHQGHFGGQKYGQAPTHPPQHPHGGPPHHLPGHNGPPHHQSLSQYSMVPRPTMYGYNHRPTPSSPPPLEPLSPLNCDSYKDPMGCDGYNGPPSISADGKGKRGRPRKHAIKIPLPPLYVFIRNLLHNRHYNPRVITWVCESQGIFKVNNTADFAKTWGLMKSNRNEEMTYEKMSRAMRYHYGSEKQGRKGHLAMVKEKRLVYRFGELAVNWRTDDVMPIRPCQTHELCGGSMCLWRKE